MGKRFWNKPEKNLVGSDSGKKKTAKVLGGEVGGLSGQEWGEKKRLSNASLGRS